MTQRIILFNGPPRSGKDTAARVCLEASQVNNQTLALYPCVFDRMSMPIKRAFAGMMGANIDRWGNVEYFEDTKEQPITILGCSYREWQIAFSEDFMKPQYGDNVFGRLFNFRATHQHKDAVIFVPDCGFDIEYVTIANCVGRENILVVKIERPGTSFKGDSRSYLKVGSKLDTIEHVIHISNSGTEDEFKRKVVEYVGEWLLIGKV